MSESRVSKHLENNVRIKEDRPQREHQTQIELAQPHRTARTTFWWYSWEVLAEQAECNIPRSILAA